MIRNLGTGATLLLTVRPCVAQVRGQIVDEAHAPLVRALVELWGPAERLAARVSDGSGRFSFDGVDAGPSAALLVRAVGFGALRVAVSPHDSTLVLAMRPVQFSLRPVVVADSSRLCQRSETRAARALWTAVASRYVDPDAVGPAVYDSIRIFDAVVSPEEFGKIDTSRLMLGEMSRGGGYYAQETALIRKSGYATLGSGLMAQRYDYWTYPKLDSFLAAHFVDSLFGQMHTFAVLATDNMGTRLVFCPKAHKHPEIEGVISIGADTSLGRVSWRFITPNPDEGAGGEVFFTPRSQNPGAQPLLPMTGLFYRRPIHGVFEEWIEHRKWMICSDPQLKNCGPLRP